MRTRRLTTSSVDAATEITTKKRELPGVPLKLLVMQTEDIMKKKVLLIVKNALGGAEDNLYRANIQFGKMTNTELLKEYGESGKTCGDILLGYQNEIAEMKRCVAWVESAA